MHGRIDDAVDTLQKKEPRPGTSAYYVLQRILKLKTEIELLAKPPPSDALAFRFRSFVKDSITQIKQSEAEILWGLCDDVDLYFQTDSGEKGKVYERSSRIAAPPPGYDYLPGVIYWVITCACLFFGLDHTIDGYFGTKDYVQYSHWITVEATITGIQDEDDSVIVDFDYDLLRRKYTVEGAKVVKFKERLPAIIEGSKITFQLEPDNNEQVYVGKNKYVEAATAFFIGGVLLTIAGAFISYGLVKKINSLRS